jgi:hypothetical protein
MGPAKNQSYSDRRRRKIALIGWALAVVVWAIFVIKDSKTQPQAQAANVAVRSTVLEHLGHESHNPLFGETNISVGKNGK